MILTFSSSYLNLVLCFSTTSSTRLTILLLSNSRTSVWSGFFNFVWRASKIWSTVISGISIALLTHLQANSSSLGEASTAAQMLVSWTMGLLVFIPSQNSTSSPIFFYSCLTASLWVSCLWNCATRFFQRSVFARTMSEKSPRDNKNSSNALPSTSNSYKRIYFSS